MHLIDLHVHGFPELVGVPVAGVLLEAVAGRRPRAGWAERLAAARIGMRMEWTAPWPEHWPHEEPRSRAEPAVGLDTGSGSTPTPRIRLEALEKRPSAALEDRRTRGAAA